MPAPPVSDGPEVGELARLLLYGSFATRQAVAGRLATAPDGASWALLATTMRRDEDWRLRARSLEILGLVAGSADRVLAEAVVAAVVGGPDLRPPPSGASAPRVVAPRPRQGLVEK